jgi:hypothetical protein
MPSFEQVSQISALLELPFSTVSAVIVKWKHLGATTAQPQSDRPHKLTGRLKHIACKKTSVLSCNANCQVPNCLRKQRQHKNGSFMKCVSMLEQPCTSLRSPYSMPSVGWCGFKLAAMDSIGVDTHYLE